MDGTLPPARQAQAQVVRALAWIDRLRLADAQAALDEAVRLDPGNIEALHLRGRLALNNGDLARAAPDIARALRLAPNDPDLLTTRATLELGPNTSAQALDDVNAALRQKPDSIDALFTRARLHLLSSDPGDAVADLNQSLAIAPDDQRARTLRAEVHLHGRAFDLAAFDAAKILAARPFDLPALRIKSDAQRGLGDDEGAVATYTTLLDTAGGALHLRAPPYHDALVARGRLYAKLGQFDKAQRDLDLLVSVRGRQALLQLQLFLRANGFPNTEITGERNAAFDTALKACFGDRVCGPNLFR